MKQQDINFFSTYQSKSHEKKSQNRYGYVLGLVVGGLVIGSFGYNVMEISKIKKDINYYNSELAKPEVLEKMKESDLAYQMKEVLEQFDTGLNSILTAVNSRDIITTQRLDLISSTLPSDVSFGSLSITNTTITMQATSKSRTAIAEVQHNLKALDFISDVYIGAISGTDSYSFSLNCVVKDVK
ncbi:MAG TPA: pilus assembly protein PilN [Firmicutes bacterium]|nr:pilus assembly protein PilN [Bacillota bacterium]